MIPYRMFILLCYVSITLLHYCSIDSYYCHIIHLSFRHSCYNILELMDGSNKINNFQQATKLVEETTSNEV